jgi:hypothetical protein
VSAPFLTTTVPNHRVSVEIAWGADVSDLDGSGWTWSDITSDVILGGKDGGEESGISITLGRPDFSQETQTAEMLCQLDNRDSAYSKGSGSPNYPNLRRGTPVRVQVSTDGGATWSMRFQGQANGFTPQWDPETGRWATVTLSASGPLRRLNQGTCVGISAIREGILADPSVVAYWPCEDRQHATFVTPAVGSGIGRFRVYDPATDGFLSGPQADCASYTNVAASAPIITAVEGGSINFALDDALTSTSSTVSFITGNITNVVPWDGTTLNFRGSLQPGVLMEFFTDQGAAVKTWELAYAGLNTATGTRRLRLRGYPQSTHVFDEGYTFRTSNVVFSILDNTPYEISLVLTQSGSTTNWTLAVRAIGLNSSEQTFSGSQPNNSGGAQISSIQLAAHSSSAGMAMGHLAVRNVAAPSNHLRNVIEGYPGEATTARLERLCTSHGIHLTTVGVNGSGVTATMGPQFYDTLTALLRECEATGQGYLFDGLGPGLTFVTKSQREANAAGPAALTLDAASGHVMEPFTPVDDDTETINRCDVTRRGGTDTTYSDLDGPMGVHAIGEFSTSLQVNPETDSGLVQYAQWMVERGTRDGYRYPSISFALEANAELVPGWLACTPQSRIDVTNITAIRRQHPDETISLLIEGWREEITAFTWRVTANTSLSERWSA